MSDVHESPQAPGHDPRLDAPHDELPQVRPSTFDLIALDRTRTGLRVIGIGLAVLPIALPLVARSLNGVGYVAVGAGWIASFAALLCLALGIAITAPTPNGPFPKPLRWLFVAICLAAGSASLVHAWTAFQGRSLSAGDADVAAVFDNAARIAFLLLPWILWRFCQHRGLTGRAIVWVWLAMATSGLALAELLTEARWLLWAYPPLGVIAFFAAQQSARDLWLDAVYRHTKFFVQTPGTAVEGLRPAGDR